MQALEVARLERAFRETGAFFASLSPAQTALKQSRLSALLQVICTKSHSRWQKQVATVGSISAVDLPAFVGCSGNAIFHSLQCQPGIAQLFVAVASGGGSNQPNWNDGQPECRRLERRT